MLMKQNKRGSAFITGVNPKAQMLRSISDQTEREVSRAVAYVNTLITWKSRPVRRVMQIKFLEQRI